MKNKKIQKEMEKYVHKYRTLIVYLMLTYGVYMYVP